MHCITQLLLTLIILLFSQVSTADSPDDWQILPGKRVGKITASSSESDLRKMYGPGNVSEIEVDQGEGETEKGTVLFPKEPKKSLQIIWKDKGKKRSPERIQWTGESSVWQTKSGITLGSSLQEIEKWNGKPFKLAGFGWDYGGTVTSWEGGALGSETSQGGRLIVRFEEPKKVKATSKERNSIQGDGNFASNNPVMKKLNPRVYQMIFEVGN
jgi:hypothetical protein